MKLILLQKHVNTHHSAFLFIFLVCQKQHLRSMVGILCLTTQYTGTFVVCFLHFQYYLVICCVIDPCILAQKLKLYHSEQSLFHFCESDSMAECAVRIPNNFCRFLCKKEKFCSICNILMQFSVYCACKYTLLVGQRAKYYTNIFIFETFYCLSRKWYKMMWSRWLRKSYCFLCCCYSIVFRYVLGGKKFHHS